MGSPVVLVRGAAAAEVGRLRSLTLANARTGVKTASEQRLRNPLLTNLTTRMRLVGFAVESGGGRVEHLSDGTNLGAGPFEFWKGPGFTANFNRDRQKHSPLPTREAYADAVLRLLGEAR